jgi:hypothetical protein
MKKRKPPTRLAWKPWPRPPRDFDFSGESASDAILYAEHRDYALLAKRVRDGRACKEEMQVVADILEGIIPPKKRGRPASPSKARRAWDIDYFVRFQMSENGYPQKAAVEDAKKRFGLSRSNIYIALDTVRRAAKADAQYEESMADEYEEARNRWLDDNCDEDWGVRINGNYSDCDFRAFLTILVLFAPVGFIPTRSHHVSTTVTPLGAAHQRSTTAQCASPNA